LLKLVDATYNASENAADLILDLPENATHEQIQVLRAYLNQQQKIVASSGYGTKNFYKEKHEILGSKLIIFLNTQKKSDVWYMRMHIGGKQSYKRISLKTSDKATAIERALDHWRNLKNQIESGGTVFEKRVSEVIADYISFLEDLVNTNQLKKHTLQCKKTSLKKLNEYLSQYDKPSEIPNGIFNEYTKWRRTKNWVKYHKNNSDPPSDLTINRELTDFKGFFDWCSKKRILTNNFEFPWIKFDPRKHKEASPPFTDEDYNLISRTLPLWYSDKNLGKVRKNNFYRGVFVYYFEILAHSGLRPHECLKLRWSDVDILPNSKKVEFKVIDDPEGTWNELDSENEALVTTQESIDIVIKKENMPAQNKWTMKTLDSIEEAVKSNRNWFEVEYLGAKIEVNPDTKTGRRIVYCPAGWYFQELWKYFQEESPVLPKRSDYIFQNIGTSHSRGDKNLGSPLSDSFFRRLWYEFRDYVNEKRETLRSDYTLYSCRSFFINLNLEMGNTPHQVAKMVGHSVATQSRHYEAIEVKKIAGRFTSVTDGQLKKSKIRSFYADEI
jgi:hypothetical protein